MKKIMLMIVVVTITLLVACETITPEVTVTYETNGGVLSGEVDTTVLQGTIISEPTINKEGSTLQGWYSDSSFNVPYDFSQGVQGDITIHAKWALNEVVVTYYTDSEYDTFTTTYGSAIPTTEDPTLLGYQFDGWFLDEALTTPVDFDVDIVTEDLTVYAKFTMIEYTLTIIALDSTVSETTNYFGDIVTLPTGYEVEGYVNTGIYEEETYTNVIHQGWTMPAEDTTIYIRMVEPSQTLRIYFAPSRPAEEILTITQPLIAMLTNEFSTLGSSYDGVEIYVGATYEVVGEALLNGLADIAFLPGGSYVLYKDVEGSPIEPLVAGTRAGLTKDFEDAKLWNDGTPTYRDSMQQTAYYRGLILAGTSTQGQAVAAKVNSGVALTWDDVKDLNWCVRSESSSSGYIYPNLWLETNFGHTFYDMGGNVISTFGYGETIASLAAGTCDVGNVYADARMDYADRWETEYGRTEDIWTETNVIGVTLPIMNDLIAYNRDTVDVATVSQLVTFFEALSDTIQGPEIMSLYAHNDYIVIEDSDYDPYRLIMD